jgi:hypothetical protein
MDRAGYGATVVTPSSASSSTIYASPAPAPSRRLSRPFDAELKRRSTEISMDDDDVDDDDDHAQNGDISPGAPTKKKQRRNKPTLSCHECVERKTKVGISL